MNNNNDEKKILKIGNPLLRQVAKPIPTEMFDSEELRTLSDILLTSLQKQQGVGLAAPQMGMSQRVIVFGFEKLSRRPNAQPIPLTVLINPELFFLSNTIEEDYEGCFSLPEKFYGKVPRYTHLAYRGFNVDGQLIEREVTGLHARVVQHECDHLDGILMVDRVKDTRSYGFYEELKTASMIA